MNEMEKNKIHNIDFLDNTLPDKCANLIIADPPYFEVKGEFDFVWKSFDDYLKDVERWAKECKRLLADNGTLFWYGSAKRIAYAQIIFDKHFKLINSLVWNKGSFLGLENSEGLRSFAPCTERVLMYSNEVDMTGLEFIEKEYVAPRNPFSRELKKARNETRYSITQVAGLGGFHGKVNHGGAVTNWEKGYNVPLKEQWKKLCDILPIERKEYEALRKEYEALRKEYEALRKEYEARRRPFDNFMNLQEVLNFNNEATKTGAKYNHDTVKPEKLTRALILTCSRKDDLVVVPFAGSGTECAMAAKEKRQFVGFEINANYSNIANKRAAKILSEPTLF